MAEIPKPGRSGDPPNLYARLFACRDCGEFTQRIILLLGCRGVQIPLRMERRIHSQKTVTSDDGAPFRRSLVKPIIRRKISPSSRPVPKLRKNTRFLSRILGQARHPGISLSKRKSFDSGIHPSPPRSIRIDPNFCRRRGLSVDSLALGSERWSGPYLQQGPGQTRRLGSISEGFGIF